MVTLRVENVPMGQPLQAGERSVEDILASLAAQQRFEPAAVGAPSSLDLLREDRGDFEVAWSADLAGGPVPLR